MTLSWYPNSWWAQTLPPKYEVDTITPYWVKTYLAVHIMSPNDLHLWPFALESCHVMPLGWSSQFLRFLGKGDQISNFIFLTPERPERRIMTYCAWGFVQKCDGPGQVTKIGQKLSCVKLAIYPDHPRWHRPLKFCMRGLVREIVIYFKFHENQSRGLGAVQAVIIIQFCKDNPSSYLCLIFLSLISPLDFFGTENISLAYLFMFLSWLEAEISLNTYFMSAILKIQNGGHSGVCANANIIFGNRML